MFTASLALLLAGCAGAREAGEEREPFVIVPSPPEGPVRIPLAQADSTVRTVQLYRLGTSEEGISPETQFPVLALGTDQQLELRFDLLAREGRPLSVFFYHANADWRHDLHPSQYIRGFHRDQVYDYTPSRATDLPYVHYAYRFPNTAFSFAVSGNYLLRVTEQGMEEEVLFERPFFVAEQAVGLQVGIENRLLSEGGFSAVQPSAVFMGGELNPYDFSVCFVRNGRFESPRCSDQPRLYQAPALQFFLEPDAAFEPETADYFLDLSALQVGNQLARIDFAATPYRVELEPDYARFPGNPLAPTLRGQTVVAGAVRDVASPDVSGQYVEVDFRYVTDSGRPLAGGVKLLGSFHGWDGRQAVSMTWNDDQEWYEARLLLKQGQYEYRYINDRDQMPRGSVPRAENLYTALVYFNDIRLQSDRLIAISTLLAP